MIMQLEVSTESKYTHTLQPSNPPHVYPHQG